MSPEGNTKHYHSDLIFYIHPGEEEEKLWHVSNTPAVYGVMADVMSKKCDFGLQEPLRNHLDPERCS